MNKKGMLIITALITLVVAVIITFLILQISVALSFKDHDFKTAVSKDIALAIDTIYAYPYDMQIEYDVNLRGIVVEITPNSVKVHNSRFVKIESDGTLSETDPTYVEYSFVPSNDNLNYLLFQPKKILFKKIDGNLKIQHILELHDK